MTGKILLIVALAGLISGCQSGSGPLFSYNSNMNSLKASVSQLEFRNEELSKQVAALKSDNRHYQDRLVQEQAENDSLASQLNNAKGRGDDFRTGSRPDSGDADGTGAPSKVRRSKSTHKPPAAAIPGRIEPAPITQPEPGGDDVGIWKPSESSRLASSRRTSDVWLPVAQGTGTGQGTVK
jgi:outer membrane murein-binding lipoprotein Lpp